ncbi:hypothetical protein ACJRO7_003995 [Eucalyptus globulus]|uniref:Nudix hydrolase domain-containing protein n=1 Tax=Eucalyptus globulus TaxID=34317 RepID=A0ABD3IXN9_EUCGL
MSSLHRSSSAPSKNGLPSQELLDDLCSRFVLNVPKEDLQSFERILFLVEYAHWFYEDNSVEKNPSLKSLSLKEFTGLLFNSCEVLRPYVAHIDDIFKDFTSYKVRVPVTGAIILDETYERCLLVKGWKGTSWSFPRGKKNKDEEDHACAIREVLEETGFDVSNLLNKDEYIEMIFGQQRVRLYVIAGVKDDTAFAPLTKKEISVCLLFGQSITCWNFESAFVSILRHVGWRPNSFILFKEQINTALLLKLQIEDMAICPVVLLNKSLNCSLQLYELVVLEIAWHRLDELQSANDAVISRSIIGLKLYMVAPFLGDLKRWILAHQPPPARSHIPLKGICIWKAKSGSTGSSSTISEPQSSKSASNVQSSYSGPGKSFRYFRFDTAAILRAMEAGFSS